MTLSRSSYRSALVAYVWPLWPRAATLALLLLATIGLQLAGPLILRSYLDATLAHRSLQALTGTAVLFLAVALLTQVVVFAESYVAEDLAWTATNKVRADVALHCLRLDMSFHHAHTPGELLERIDGDAGMLATFLSRFVVAVAGNLLFLAGVLVVLLRLDWRVGLALTSYAVGALVVLQLIRGLGASRWDAARQSSADLFGYLEERLAGTEDVRANGATAYLLARLYPLLRRRLHTERSAEAFGVLMFGTRDVLFALGTVVAFGLSAYLFQRGLLTAGTVYLVFAYTQHLGQPLNDISRYLDDLQQARVGLARLQALLQTRPIVADGPGAALPAGALSVQFEEVSFSYAQETPVLHGVSFNLAPGRVLGVLGRTGSGKTTLARLLFRLYDPTAGTVRLGGVDLRDARLAGVRGCIGLVTQDVQLFGGTLRDNLTVFDGSLRDSALLAALEDLGLGGWYAGLPQGLETELASGGSFSAGEAQLLALVRVFLREPGVIVLDEASSRLDPITEALLDRAISRLLRGRTGIVIAHRLATVQRADEILILDHGQVVEHGSREELAGDAQSYFSRLLRTGSEEVVA